VSASGSGPTTPPTSESGRPRFADDEGNVIFPKLSEEDLERINLCPICFLLTFDYENHYKWHVDLNAAIRDAGSPIGGFFSPSRMGL
jgi:hypothetical protein